MKKLFAFLDEFRQEINDKLDESDKKIDSIYNILDKQTGLMDTDETERLALSKQVDRHEDWISRAAPAVGVTYTVKS